MLCGALKKPKVLNLIRKSTKHLVLSPCRLVNVLTYVLRSDHPFFTSNCRVLKFQVFLNLAKIDKKKKKKKKGATATRDKF